MRLPSHLTISFLRQMYRKDSGQINLVFKEVLKRAHEEQSNNVWIKILSAPTIRTYLQRITSLSVDTHPLWGIPFAVKDNIDIAGIETTAACPEFAYTPKENAFVVQQLIDAGAIPIGKTNMDQFATGLVGTRSPFGPVHNSKNYDMISGGSSSGSAVAVSLGSVAFSLGTDTAGSGRVPAALNGIWGLKPPRGHVSIRGIVPACESIDCVAIFANTLDDAQRIYSVAHKYDAQDPWSKQLNDQQHSSQQISQILIPGEEPHFFGPQKERYQRNWHQVVNQLKSLNIPIQKIPFQDFRKSAKILYGGPWVAERMASLQAFIDLHPNALLPEIHQVLFSSRNSEKTAVNTFKAIHFLQGFKNQLKTDFANAVLVTPTTAGTWSIKDIQADPVAKNSDMGMFTNFCNLLDLSAMAIPVSNDEYPFGITVFSTSDQFSLVNQVAAKYDESRKISTVSETTN